MSALPWLVALGALGTAGALYWMRQQEKAEEETAPGGFLGSGALSEDYGGSLTEQGGDSPGKRTLPYKLAELFDAIQRDPNKTPQAIARLAADFAQQGFPIAANELQKNALYRAGTLPGIPYVIESGDTPATIAMVFTGDANRWKELIGTPSSKGTLLAKLTGAGTYLLTPWWVGQRIYLPKSWAGSM